MKNDQRRFETSLKMPSKVGIIAFTILGVVAFLLCFLGLAFTAPKPVATWKILVGGIGGAIFLGVVMVATLRFGRYLLMKRLGDNSNITIQ